MQRGYNAASPGEKSVKKGAAQKRPALGGFRVIGDQLRGSLSRLIGSGTAIAKAHARRRIPWRNAEGRVATIVTTILPAGAERRESPPAPPLPAPGLPTPPPQPTARFSMPRDGSQALKLDAPGSGTRVQELLDRVSALAAEEEDEERQAHALGARVEATEEGLKAVEARFRSAGLTGPSRRQRRDRTHERP